MNLILIALSILYPIIFYFGRTYVHPAFFIVAALALIGLRVATIAKNNPLFSDLNEKAKWLTASVLALSLIFCSLAVSVNLAAKAYPVLLSFSVGAVFLISLWSRRSVIERFARLAGPSFPEKGIPYCRKLTVIWAVWMFINAAVAAFLAFYASDHLWALWTGGINYLVSGALFLGEFVFRRVMKLGHS